MRSVAVQPEAEQETDDAVAWYEDKEPGLGLRFLHDLDLLYATIARRPEMFQIVKIDFRRALMRKFPYSVFYGFDEQLVIVHCVFHCSRKPAVWKRRLGIARKHR